MSQHRTLEESAGSVLIRFGHNDKDASALRALCKQHGARWSPERKCWVIALEQSNELVSALHRGYEFEVF